MKQIGVLVFILCIGVFAEASPASLCNVNLGPNRGRADVICRRAGHTLLAYTQLSFAGARENSRVLGYGCDCNRILRRPAGVTVPNLCIRTEQRGWDGCATFECDYPDYSPWCTSYNSHS